MSSEPKLIASFRKRDKIGDSQAGSVQCTKRLAFLVGFQHISHGSNYYVGLGALELRDRYTSSGNLREAEEENF